MKRILSILLILCGLTAWSLAEEGDDFMINSRNIPEELEAIPEEYYQPAAQAGQMVQLDYDTWESFSYAEKSYPLRKTAWVYLPYGYTEDEQYNVFYFMHGGWSNETTQLGTAEAPGMLKHVIDHAIQDGKMKPMIIVCPTYNNTSPEDSGDYGLALRLTDQYHNELVNDLLPAVESRFSTYAENVSLEGLHASRNHRGFGGFSMGSVTTWHTFEYCLDYFRYFMPMSGNMGLDGRYWDYIVQQSGYNWNDFFLFTASGTADFAYSGFRRQIEGMAAINPDSFRLADNEAEGNLAYREKAGYQHNHMAMMEYTYNGLCWFWNL